MNRIAIATVIPLCFPLFACGSSSGDAAPPGSGGQVQDAATSPTGGSIAAGGAAGGPDASGGSATAGGATGTGGTTVAGGATGAGGSPPTVNCTAEYTGSAARPLLTDASAACYSIKNYLAEAGPLSALARDDWDPSAGLPSADTYSPTYTVAADGSGTHTTVQAAIDAANASTSSSRVYILVKPGTYRELVCVKGSVPITLYGADTDASNVAIAFDNYADRQVANGPTNACASPGSSATFGTTGSSTFFVLSSGFQAANLTIANDFDESTVAATAKVQAVALTVQGDKEVFQNIRLIGNQDTLQVKSSFTTTVARSYFKNSYVEGDTDFIFGRGTAVFDGCTITYVSSRKNNGTVIAPSTNAGNPFGFLVINSRMVGDAGMTAGTAYLGRAWDDSSDPQANGQAVIRNTQIGGFVKLATPWATSTGSRVFSASGNRLYEYQNTGAGAASGGVDGGAAVDAVVDAPAPVDAAAAVDVGSGQSDGDSSAG